MAEFLALSAVLKQKLIDLLRLVERMELLLQKADLSKDEDYIDGVALHLQSFYTTIEQMFEAIASAFGEGVSSGANWHQNLLLPMSVENPQIRPAVISQATRQSLDEYRSFRHVARNVYMLNLRLGRVRELVGSLRNCYESVSKDLMTFCNFLETIAHG